MNCDINTTDCSPVEVYHHNANRPCYKPKMIDECITVHFLVGIKEIEHLYDVRIFISKDANINKLIQKAIVKFNEEKYTLNDPKSNSPLYLIQLKEDNISYYELKPCKKTGYPKYDYPPFNHRMRISDAQTTDFAILFDKTLLVLLPCNKSVKMQKCKDMPCLII